MKNLRIHVCCGGVYLDNYINIDKYPFEQGDDSRSGCVADVMSDVFNLPYGKGTVSEIVLIHGMEHFTRYDGVRLINIFSELLTDDGILYLEQPSRYPVFLLCVLERLFAMLIPKKMSVPFGKGLASSMLWGNQWAGFDYETHRYLWSTVELLEVASEQGLKNSKVFRYTTSHVPFRDMGLAFSRTNKTVDYMPPKITRNPMAGFHGFIIALLKGGASVLKSVIK